MTFAMGFVTISATTAGLAAALLPRHRAVPVERAAVAATSEPVGLVQRWRLLWSVLAFVGAASFVPGPVGISVAVGTAVGCWVLVGRTEPRAVRRRREQAAQELPHVVLLLAAALRAGRPPEDAIRVVTAALPGAASDRLAGVVIRLGLGVDPTLVWRGLVEDPVLAPLGRTLARSHASGAPVADAVDRLSWDLDHRRRASVEDQARTVGVKAALPLGLCLLPAFLLVGVVPVVAGLLARVTQ